MPTKTGFDAAVDDKKKRDDSHQTPLTQQHLDVANVQQRLLIICQLYTGGMLT